MAQLLGMENMQWNIFLLDYLFLRVDSPSAEAPAIPLIRTISGSPGAPNVYEKY